MKTRLLTIAVAAVFAASVVGTAPATQAASDYELKNFGTKTANGIDKDAAGFENFVGDLALALHPKFAGPAMSTGSLGMEFGYILSITDIQEQADHWTKPVESPEDLLLGSQFYARKGLPYGFELGGILSHLHGSNIWAVGIELKWAFVEGHKYAPDFALRTHVNTLLGNRDLVMITSGGEFIVSKAFGIGGLIQLTPFAGYQLTYVHARSHVLGLFDVGDLKPATFILPTRDFVRHRGFLGLKVLAGIVDVSFEAALGDVMSYSFRFGFNL